jgi:hypothetical protein
MIPDPSSTDFHPCFRELCKCRIRHVGKDAVIIICRNSSGVNNHWSKYKQAHLFILANNTNVVKNYIVQYEQC